MTTGAFMEPDPVGLVVAGYWRRADGHMIREVFISVSSELWPATGVEPTDTSNRYFLPSISTVVAGYWRRADGHMCLVQLTSVISPCCGRLLA